MSSLKKTGKNFFLLVGGQVIAAGMGLIALALAAQSLQPAELGVLVLLHTYVVTVRELLNCKPFEAIVRFGVPRYDAGDIAGLKRLLWFSFRLDLACTAAAGLLAFALVGPLGGTLGWQTEHAPLAYMFCAALCLSAVETAKGVLRLKGEFALLSSVAMVSSGVRLLGVLVAWSRGGGIGAFACAWALGLVAEYLYFNVLGWRACRGLGTARTSTQSALPIRREFPGIWAFINVVYWQGNLDLLPKHVATLLVGSLLGATDAGLFRIAREFSAVFAKPVVLLRQVVFPDLTRMWHQGDLRLGRVCLRLALITFIPAALLTGIFALVGETVIAAIFGLEYAVAVSLITLLLIAAAIELAGATLRPAGYAINKATAMLWLQIINTVLLFSLMVAGARLYGLPGVGAASCVSAVFITGALATVVFSELRRQRVAAEQSG